MNAGIILVNGAGGFVGSTVKETLCSRGDLVRATDLPGSNLDPARRAEAEVLEADLLDPASAWPRPSAGIKLKNGCRCSNHRPQSRKEKTMCYNSLS